MDIPGAMNMRERIIQQSTRLFVVNGYNAVSMREIAMACDITKAALYYHFKNKQELILDIFRDYLLEMSNLIDNCCQVNISTRETLTKMISDIMAQPSDRRGIIRLGTQEIANLDMDARQEFGILYQRYFINKITHIFEEGVTKKEIRPIDPHLATWIFLGMMYPFFYPGQERRQNWAQIPEVLSTIFFEGISAV
jgi:AcrR family transcriptional regulator